ncbi:uncharacterized protein SAPINGB_P000435 [Magnusiomyces paraingens]|uniref:squalene synthase n=1 Tax=Magnusiomyces paraingens TaxID=2606893 RepID=A0A5E8AZ75_9ASCO|nr:uncharacterized protein SAPINGB_P000435 [Saprochaete ingens]VVT44494.1 unnamed protein product [Saprochaete ingens]
MGKLADLLLHPSELRAALQIKFFPSVLYPRDTKSETPELHRCYELLNLTSRSFAAVIQQLHPELRDAIALFYIILRALDTVEDDMTLSLDTKIPLLRKFDTYLTTPGWTFNDSGPDEKDRVVLVEFDVVIAEYSNLKPEYREVIADITRRMGAGMADYAIDSDFTRDGLETVDDYNLYCYYVAGLVGEGLTRMAIISQFGGPILAEEPDLHLAMGLFLQKTNIIRDFKEDLDDGRTFYPKELWARHVSSLKELNDPAVYTTKGLHVLTEMTINVLELVPKVLQYLDNINEPTLFRFCAIPQVMAIATLELVFNNIHVFETNVKIRRGLACKLILLARSRKGVYDVFREYVQRIHDRNVATDPNYLKLEILCGKIEQYIQQHYPKDDNTTLSLSKAHDDSLDSLMILAAAGGFAIATCAIMVGVAYAFGANFSFSLQDAFPFLADSKLT